MLVEDGGVFLLMDCDGVGIDRVVGFELELKWRPVVMVAESVREDRLLLEDIPDLELASLVIDEHAHGGRTRYCHSQNVRYFPISAHNSTGCVSDMLT